jgi:tetratricopeptide (TPR) repeat protein
MFMNKATILTMLGGVMVVSACSNLQSIANKSADQQITVNPDPLVLHGDSVRFDMEARLPQRMMNKNITYIIEPQYEYQNRFQDVNGRVVFDGANVARNETPQRSQSMSFPYREGMENGNLNVVGRVAHKKKDRTASTSSVKVADGVITTSRLARVGQYSGEGDIPMLGVYMGHGYSDLAEIEPTEVEFFFQQGRSTLRPSEVNSERGRYLKAFIADSNITKTVTITGTHSPEGSERINRDLSKNRAQQIELFYRTEMEKYDYRGESQDVNFIIKPVVDDWSDFRVLLDDYDGLTDGEKVEYFEIIGGPGDFDSKERAMQRLPTYRRVFNDLYPKLRIAKTEILTTKDKKSEAEISTLSNQIVRGNLTADQLSEEEMGYAAALEPSLNTKQRIYEAQVQAYNSPMAHNNLGVVYLNQASRTASSSEKNDLLNKAIRSFEAANASGRNGYATHNLGQVYLMRGDFQTAYKYFSDASTMDVDGDDFTQMNDGIRGAVDILNGDYKLATIRLNNAPENEINLFNKGLAYLLAEDYRNATNAFEESVMVNRDFGYGYYGLAIIAARAENAQVANEQLKKAVERSSELKRRAATDLEFRAIRDSSGFREAIR